MRTYREFIVEADAASHPDIAGQTEFQKRVAAEMKRRQSARQAKQGTYKKTGQTRTPPTGEPFKPQGKPGSPGNTQTGFKKPGFKMPKVKVPQGAKQAAGVAGKAAGPALTAVDAALTYKGRRDAGESRKRAAAGTAAQVGTGLAAAKAGALGGAAIGGAVGGPIGAGIGGVVGGIGGYAAGSKVGKSAFNVAAGATPQQRKTMATTNRQRQSGGALVGTGGKTTFDTKKNTMTTGGKTVQLAKTSVVKDPTTGKLDTGYLAYKGGKAVYKRAADPSTLAKTSTNPLERIGRTLNPSAYKQSDELKRQQALRQASQSDIKRQQALGVKGSKNLVGPKIVGSPTGYKPAGGGMGGARGGRK